VNAASKFWLDTPLFDHHRTFKWALVEHGIGLAAVSLRYFNVAGASNGAGEDHHPETHLIPNVLRAALDDPTLVRADVGQVARLEGSYLQELVRQALGAGERSIGVHQLDALPSIALVRLEDRPDLDLYPRLLPDLAGERVFARLRQLARLIGREPVMEAG